MKSDSKTLVLKKQSTRAREKKHAVLPLSSKTNERKTHTSHFFPEEMQQLAKETMNRDHEGDAAILAKAAKIVCNEICQHTGFHFDASFPVSCQDKTIVYHRH